MTLRGDLSVCCQDEPRDGCCVLLRRDPGGVGVQQHRVDAVSDEHPEELGREVGWVDVDETALKEIKRRTECDA